MGCLFEQNLAKDIYWINLDLFAIHVMANLRGELMLQLAQPDQHFYHDGWILEWLGVGLELPCTYRQIVSNAIEDSRPLRQRHSGQPFAQDLRIQFVSHGTLSESQLRVANASGGTTAGDGALAGPESLKLIPFLTRLSPKERDECLFAERLL